jgi:dTMP kinase
LTVLLDVDVEVGLGRRKKNGVEWNRMDAHEIEFYQRVRAGYLKMVQQEPGRWVVIDTGREWQSIQEELRKVIEERL